jgi:membrane fusion protein, multidrug efflux system
MVKAVARLAGTSARCRRTLGAVAVALLAAACGKQESAPVAAAPPPAVTVVQLRPQDVTASFAFLGRVVAVDTVGLRARVQGFLEQRLFTEGDKVKKGQLLYVIEQPPFQAKVDEADAGVARAEASLAEADATLTRVQQAVKSGAVSKQELDQAVAGKDVAQAQVKSAEAQLETARLNLGYTDIMAPINGRIGLTNYTIGNLVGPDSGVLATIVSQDPIYVTFPVSTRLVLAARRDAAQTGRPPALVVRAQLPDGTIYDHPGKVDFLNIQVEQTTETINVRAQFPNPEGFLVDGQFVNVTVEQAKPELALVIPQSALQVDQAGSYVLVVNAKDEVEQKRIQTGQASAGNVVVSAGLEDGDRVIVEGVQKVRPGDKVQVSVLPPASTAPGAQAPGQAAPAAGAAANQSGQPQTPASGRAEGAAAPQGVDAAPAAPPASTVPTPKPKP